MILVVLQVLIIILFKALGKLKKIIITTALALGLLVVGTTTAQVKTHWDFSETGAVNVTANA